jgi:hypothetical protein
LESARSFLVGWVYSPTGISQEGCSGPFSLREKVRMRVISEHQWPSTFQLTLTPTLSRRTGRWSSNRTEFHAVTYEPAALSYATLIRPPTRRFDPMKLIGSGWSAPLVVAVCSGLPLAWMLGALIFAGPRVRAELHVSSFRAELLGRTLAYNGLAALIATLMGIPAGFVLGRGRGLVARLLWVLLPAALLMPSLSYAYGWAQLARLSRDTLRPFGVTFIPGGTADTLRCIWSLAAWLWAVPAGIIGLSLRRVDPGIQQQAMLDGAPRRGDVSPALAGDSGFDRGRHGLGHAGICRL